MKTCTKCKDTKSKSEFYKDKSTKCGLCNKCKSCCKHYYEANKEELAVKSKAYRQENKEKVAVKSKAYYEANKEQINVQVKDYYVANKEKVAVKNKAYREANPERGIAGCHKRRALKRNAEGVYTHMDIINLIQIQDSKCVYCQIELITIGKGKYHIDHIMPLSLGGSNYPSNLQLLCATCNLSKSATHPDIYEKQINHNQNKEL